MRLGLPKKVGLGVRLVGLGVARQDPPIHDVISFGAGHTQPQHVNFGAPGNRTDPAHNLSEVTLNWLNQSYKGPQTKKPIAVAQTGTNNYCPSQRSMPGQ